MIAEHASVDIMGPVDLDRPENDRNRTRRHHSRTYTARRKHFLTSVIDICSRYICWNRQILDILYATERAQNEILKALDVEQTAAAEIDRYEIPERHACKNLCHAKRLHSGGIQHGNDRPGAHSGNGIRLQSGILYRHKGSGVGKTARPTAAQGYAEAIGFRFTSSCTTLCGNCLGRDVLFECHTLILRKISQKK